MAELLALQQVHVLPYAALRCPTLPYAALQGVDLARITAIGALNPDCLDITLCQNEEEECALLDNLTKTIRTEYRHDHHPHR